MTTPTLGPWVDGHNVSHEPTVRSQHPDPDNGGFIVATCHGPHAREHARLIATVPEMLAFARWAAGTAGGQHADPEALLRQIGEHARAVVGKAEYLS